MSRVEEIAAAAARLVVEHGMEYGPAKRRAARDLGRHHARKLELPSNEVVEDEVREHLALFCADTQPAELRALRLLAAHWMERLAAFRPHLSGAVWRGTATRDSSLHIDLYCDDQKSTEIALINLGIDFDIGTLDAGPRAVDVLSLAVFSPDLVAPVTLHLLVRDLDDQRGALRPDARGRSWRGDLPALRRLLDATPGSP